MACLVFQAILVSCATLVSGTILATVPAPVTPERMIGNRGMGELALWWWVGRRTGRRVSATGVREMGSEHGDPEQKIPSGGCDGGGLGQGRVDSEQWV